jgi:hypothetical protein
MFIIHCVSRSKKSYNPVYCGTFGNNPVYCGTFGNMLVFYEGELLDPRPTVGLEDHPMSPASPCVFGVLAVVAHVWRTYVSLAT